MRAMNRSARRSPMRSPPRKSSLMRSVMVLRPIKSFLKIFFFSGTNPLMRWFVNCLTTSSLVGSSSNPGGDGSASSAELINSVTGVISNAAVVEREAAEEATAETAAGREEEATLLPVEDDEDPEADVPLRTIPLGLCGTERLCNPTGPAFLFFFVVELIVDEILRVISVQCK